MVIARRIGAGIVFLLAVITFLLAATGIIGAWFAKATVDQASLAAIDLVARSLGLAVQTIDGVDSGLADAEQTVADVQVSAQALLASGPAGPQAQALRGVVADELQPRLDRLGNGATNLRDGVAEFNQALSRLDALPFVELPQVGTNLDAPVSRIAEAGAQAQELRAALESLDGARLAAASEGLAARLSSARGTLATTRDRLSTTQASLVDVRTALTFWSTVGTAALSTLLALFALGQLSLAAHAWGWMRR